MTATQCGTSLPFHPEHWSIPARSLKKFPHRLILRHSNVGDLILDPFLGSGQTTKVAVKLDRRAVGYDIQPEYVQYATRRLEEPLQIRKKQLQLKIKTIPLTEPAQKINLVTNRSELIGNVFNPPTRRRSSPGQEISLLNSLVPPINIPHGSNQRDQKQAEPTGPQTTSRSTR